MFLLRETKTIDTDRFDMHSTPGDTRATTRRDGTDATIRAIPYVASIKISYHQSRNCSIRCQPDSNEFSCFSARCLADLLALVAHRLSLRSCPPKQSDSKQPPRLILAVYCISDNIPARQARCGRSLARSRGRRGRTRVS